MNPLLAQAPAAFTGQWFYVAMLGIGAIVGFLAIIAYFATKRDVDNLEKRLDKTEASISSLSAKSDVRHEELIEAGRERSHRIYEQIDDTRKELDEKIDSLRDDVANTPARVIAELRNTKGLL